MAPELTAARQAMMKTSYKLDVVLCQAGDIRKQVTGMRDQLRRMEIMLQKIVYSQRNTTEPALGRSTPEGNFKYPSTGFSVVATGWENPDEVCVKNDARFEDGMVVSKSEGVEFTIKEDLDCAVLEDFGIPSWLFELSLPTPDPIQEPTLVKQWPQSPKEYLSQPHSKYQHRQWNPNFSNERVHNFYKSLEPLEWNQQNETNLAVVNNPDEAKFDLAQLYVGDTGLFWKLPPWPDFCTMNCDSFLQHCGYGVIENFYSVRKVILIIPGDYSDLELKSVGTVEVNLVQARDLTNKDVIGKSDPFAIFLVDLESVYALAMNDTGTLLVSDSTQQVVRVWDPGRSKNMRWQSSPLEVGGGLTFGVVSAAGRAQTLPKNHHCFSMRLTLEYSKFSSLDSDEPFARKFNNPKNRHYVILPKNIIAASVVMNSTVRSAKKPGNIVFHILTDAQNYSAMKLWLVRNTYKKAYIHVINYEAILLEKSSKFSMRQLYLPEEFRVLIYNISYIRGLFPEKYFNDNLVLALEMKIKKLMAMDDESRRLIDWMEKGVNDALQKKYLKTLLFCICEKEEGPMIEEYSFSFSYPTQVVRKLQ